MARYPGATWRPIDTQYIGRIPMAVYNRVNLHVTAGKGSPWGFFNGPGKASSHFFVYKDGRVEQFQDTAYRAEGDLEGNDATISIETEGGYPWDIAQSEPWTDAQLDALVKLVAWIMETHDIPKRLATDSQLGESSRGLSWHRLGIDGNFPELPSILAGRRQRGGGMHYSLATGKVCPGNAKIEQIPGILARITGEEVVEVSRPVTQPKPVPVPKPTPKLNKYGRPLLVEDGRLGPLTIKEWQRQSGTLVDGYITGARHAGGQFWTTGYSQLIAAAQRHFGTKADGYISRGDSSLVRAMQRRFRTPVDGHISWPVSTLVAALQHALNTGTY